MELACGFMDGRPGCLLPTRGSAESSLGYLSVDSPAGLERVFVLPVALDVKS